MKFFIKVFYLSVLVAHAAQAAGPTGGAIQGTLLAPGGVPVTSANVAFKVQIWDKNATCMLYEETHAGIDLSSTNGDFSFDLGKGASRTNNVDGTAALKQNVFRNDVNITADPLWCAAGLTFASGDERVIRLQYDIGSGFVTMIPDMRLQGGVYSVVAETLQGRVPSDFVTIREDVTHDLSQANIENIFSSANYTKLSALLAGTASFTMNNQRITNLATPIAATDAANKDYTDKNVGGKEVDVSLIGPATNTGHTLVWDGGQNKWITAIPNDTSKLPLAGGTMTGAIAMGAQDITNIGHMTMANLRTIKLGSYDNAQEAALIATPLVAADEGRAWYNHEDNVFKIWNGSRAVTQAATNASGELETTMIPGSILLDGGNTRAGIINIGANDAFAVNIETTGSPRLTVGATGLVGIGNTNPSSRLDILDSVATTGGQTATILQNATDAATASRSALTLRNRGTGAGMEYNLIGQNAAGTANLFLRQDGGASFGGAVGIGTTANTTGTILDITGTGTTASSIIIPRDTTANRPAAGVNGMMRYNTTTEKFEVYQAGAWTDMIVSGSLGFANGSAGSPSITFASDTNTGIFNAAADTLGFTTAGTEVMRIDSWGQVGIGTTNPLIKLDISHHGNNPNGARITNPHPGASSSAGLALVSDTAQFSVRTTSSQSTPANSFSIFDSSNGLHRLVIGASGNVGIGTTEADKAEREVQLKAKDQKIQKLEKDNAAKTKELEDVKAGVYRSN